MRYVIASLLLVACGGSVAPVEEPPTRPDTTWAAVGDDVPRAGVPQDPFQLPHETPHRAYQYPDASLDGCLPVLDCDGTPWGTCVSCRDDSRPGYVYTYTGCGNQVPACPWPGYHP